MTEQLEIKVLLRNLATRQLNNLKKSFLGLRKGVGAIGGAVTSLQGKIAALGVTLSTGMFIRSAIRTFTEFDDVMRAVGAVSNATAEELQALTDIAKEMGRKTKFSASDAADGLRFLSMAGFEAQESIEALPGVLQLAAAGALELGTAADIATNILTAFGLEVNQLGQVNDVLVKTFTTSNTNLIELGEGFKMVGPIAAGVGADFEDVVGSLGKLADAGLKGTLSGTALRGAINALLNPTAEEEKLMAGLQERMGGVALQVRDAQGNFIGFTEVIRQLEQAGLKGDEALELFGLRAGPGMAALLGIGADKLKAYHKSLQQAAGTSEKVAREMSAGIGGATREMAAAFEGLKITFGEVFNDDMIAGIRATTKFLTTLQNKIIEMHRSGELQQYKEVFVDAFEWMSSVVKALYTEVNMYSKLVVSAIHAVTGNLDAAKLGIKDFTREFLGLDIIERIGMDKAISKLEKQIRLTEEKIAKNKEDAKSWRAKIVGAEAYERELEKNQKRLEVLKNELKLLTDKKQRIELTADLDEIKKISKEGIWGRGEAEKPVSPDELDVSGPIGKSKMASTEDSKEIKKAQVSAEALLTSEQTKLQAVIDKELAALEAMYSQGVVDLKQYFAEREALTRESIQSEIEILQERLKMEDDPNKRQAINDKIFVLEQELQARLLDLTKERLEEEERLEKEKLRKEQDLQNKKIAAERAFANLKSRTIEESSGAAAIESKYQKDLAELQMRQQKELEIIEQGQMKEAQIKEFYRLQDLERKKLLEAKEQAITEYRLDFAEQIAGGVADVFGQMYEMTGKKQKEFFYAQKAAALAQATINIAQGITKAWGQGGVFGAVGAAMVGAAGAVQIAQILAAGYAKGGEVDGHSPTKTSDNIVARLTAGEYVQPVSAVDYYGAPIMEALRQKRIPKELFSGAFKNFSIPSYGNIERTRFASGGSVSSGPSEMNAAQQEKPKTDIYNIVDPSIFEKYMSSSSGKDAIINVIRGNAFEIKNALATEG